MNEILRAAITILLVYGLIGCGARTPAPQNTNAQLDALAAQAVASGAIKPLAADFQ